MKRFLVVLASLAVASCAGVTEMRGKSPVATRISTKTATAVAQCIQAAWSAQHIGIEANGAALSEDGVTLLVVSPPGGYPSELAEVTPALVGTQVRLFAQASVDIGNRTGKRLSAVDRCI